ncbi:MAG: hypothetical protein MUO85_01730 [candidate division Zixibacteria bacterium]|nr:hypothetical protein [candidate division Zixibacteria bacterium]
MESSSSKPLSFSDYMRGVWVNKDREMVMTDKFLIDFRIDANGGIWAKLSLLEYKDSNLVIDTRGVVYAHGKDKIMKVCLKDILGKSDSLVFNTSKEIGSCIKKETFDMKRTDNKEIVLNSSSEKMIVTKEGSLEIFRNDSLLASLFRIEHFDISEDYIPAKKLSESTIKVCLVNWILRSVVIKDGKGNNVGLEINTREHMYIFYVLGLDSVYCRAARYATSDKGIVFDQNIRASLIGGEWGVFSAKDNTIAAEEKSVDENLFNAEACAFTKSGIYWSVKSAADDIIELNGCGGETYKWERPTKEDSSDVIEWIR